jgi:hypothetical protein
MYSSKLFNHATTLPLRPRSFNPSEAWIGLDCGPIPVAQPDAYFFQPNIFVVFGYWSTGFYWINSPTHPVKFHWARLEKIQSPSNMSNFSTTRGSASNGRWIQRCCVLVGLTERLENISGYGQGINMDCWGLGGGSGLTKSKPGCIPGLDAIPTKRTRPKWDGLNSEFVRLSMGCLTTI